MLKRPRAAARDAPWPGGLTMNRLVDGRMARKANTAELLFGVVTVIAVWNTLVQSCSR